MGFQLFLYSLSSKELYSVSSCFFANFKMQFSSQSIVLLRYFFIYECFNNMFFCSLSLFCTNPVESCWLRIIAKHRLTYGRQSQDSHLKGELINQLVFYIWLPPTSIERTKSIFLIYRSISVAIFRAQNVFRNNRKKI